MSAIIAAYAMFFLGYFLHMGLQIDAAVRAKNNAACSRWTVISQNFIVLGARLFISFTLLAFLRGHPEYLGPILGFAGISVSNIAVVTSTWIFAAGWGYTVDSIMTFIPVLKNFVPSLNEVQTKVTVQQVTQPGEPPKTTTTVEATTHTVEPSQGSAK